LFSARSPWQLFVFGFLGMLKYFLAMSTRIVAIIGRPNVGKSTLFNRILGAREAIVHDVSGVTRDRKYADTEWAGKRFTIIDTGGYVPESDDVFERAIREQAEIAIQEADAIVFVLDAVTGVTPLDMELSRILRKIDKPIHCLVNKVDSDKREILTHEFHELGLGDPLPISALAGRGIGDFLDRLTEGFGDAPEVEEGGTALKIAIIGKPNVGKSSIVNALLGKNRQVVTNVPGTTRDPVDSVLKYHGESFVLVDTAGLRKKKRVAESLEFYSALRTLKSIVRSDVAVVVLDAVRGLDHQDLHIISTALDRNRPSILAVNKWDLVEKDSRTPLEYERLIREQLGLLDYLPIVFVSALTRQRIAKLLELAKELNAQQHRKIDTSELNEVLLAEIRRTPPSTRGPKEIKIKYVTQVKTRPPVFSFFCNEPKLVEETYRRFLMNRIREHFGFSGVPVKVVFKQK
jgi:GTP-binding protein